MKLLQMFGGVALACLVGFAHAAETAGADAQLVELVDAQKTLRAEIESGSKKLGREQREQVLKAQDELFKIHAANPDDAQISEKTWTQIAGINQRISDAITASAKGDERIVCKRFRPTGSNRSQSKCHSVAQWRDMQLDQAEMSRMSRQSSQAQPPRGG